MTKKILIINGNPKQSSYVKRLCDLYAISAKKNHSVKIHNLSLMQFNPSLDDGYDDIQKLEPCLVEFQEATHWADHVVIIAPVWWGTVPAKLKGLFDRALLPGVAFNYEAGNPLPIQLLTGKTSRIILTMDTPPEYYLTEQSAPAIAQLDICTLQFCGFEKAAHNLFGPIVDSPDEERATWEKEVSELGLRGA